MADTFDTCADRREFCLARYDLILGIAALHRQCRGGGILRVAAQDLLVLAARIARALCRNHVGPGEAGSCAQRTQQRDPILVH